MEILVANHTLSIGGGESYLVTVAEQLQRLGHQVTVFAPEEGESTEDTRERGLRVVTRERDLPDEPTVIYALDSFVAYLLADLFPTTPQVHNVLAEEYDLCVPPQLPGITAAVVVLHSRVEHRAQAFAHGPEIVRLRQPVDTQRFAPHTPLRDPPRRVLLLGNYLRAERRAVVERACKELGLECVQVGGPSGCYTTAPEQLICEADIVVGKARVIVEAMACGRAAYVYDRHGGDGWVTPERYDAFEADNFAGLADGAPMSAARLRAELACYRPEMGLVNRELALLNHAAFRHAHQLVALFRRVAPGRSAVDGPFRELARLVRVQWSTEHRAVRLAAELESVAQERNLLAAENERLLTERAKAYETAESTIAWARGAGLAAREAEAREQALLTTRRVRFANAIALPIDKLRQLRASLRPSWTR
ncbi:MAG: glycosyltransferase [Actinomycetota bacterium]|nr:glycosyltransferase [Actinomycetota bacterium]